MPLRAKTTHLSQKIVNTRLTKIFMAIFAPAERLPSSATLHGGSRSAWSIYCNILVGLFSLHTQYAPTDKAILGSRMDWRGPVPSGFREREKEFPTLTVDRIWSGRWTAPWWWCCKSCQRCWWQHSNSLEEKKFGRWQMLVVEIYTQKIQNTKYKNYKCWLSKYTKKYKI